MTAVFFMPLSSASDMWKATCNSDAWHHLWHGATLHSSFIVNWSRCSATWWKSQCTNIRNCMSVCFPSWWLFFFLSFLHQHFPAFHPSCPISSLSLSLTHSPQTLALLQMRIDPSVNLISMILCRAFSFYSRMQCKANTTVSDHSILLWQRVAAQNLVIWIKKDNSKNVLQCCAEIWHNLISLGFQCNTGMGN